MNLIGDVAMDEDAAWGRDSDDAVGGTGVRTSKPENLTLLADNNRAVPCSGCLQLAVFTTPDHCSLA